MKGRDAVNDVDAVYIDRRQAPGGIIQSTTNLCPCVGNMFTSPSRSLSPFFFST